MNSSLNKKEIILLVASALSCNEAEVTVTLKALAYLRLKYPLINFEDLVYEMTHDEKLVKVLKRTWRLFLNIKNRPGRKERIYRALNLRAEKYIREGKYAAYFS